MSDYDERRAREREEQRRYENDVFYDVWRSGGNVDRINDDRVSDSYYDGRSAEDAARRELRSQRPHREEEYPEEEQYPEQEFPAEEVGEQPVGTDRATATGEDQSSGPLEPGAVPPIGGGSADPGLTHDRKENG
jgi:hypothetical protein